VDTADDDTRTVRSLAAWLKDLHFTDLTADQATARLIDAVAEWGISQGWRVYRRAPSVFPLPPPLKGHSVIDVACARPTVHPTDPYAGRLRPIAVEVDRLDRQRTVDKLLAEAAAGRLAIWVRWGSGPFHPPPLPVHLVTREAARSRGAWHTAADRPAPRHAHAVEIVEAEELPWKEPP
jgi:hypothetical protein